MIILIKVTASIPPLITWDSGFSDGKTSVIELRNNRTLFNSHFMRSHGGAFYLRCLCGCTLTKNLVRGLLQEVSFTRFMGVAEAWIKSITEKESSQTTPD